MHTVFAGLQKAQAIEELASSIYQAAARRDWYLSLWERREALNAALLERHPKLARYLEAPAAQ